MRALLTSIAFLLLHSIGMSQADTVMSFDGVNDQCRYEGDSMKSGFSVDLYFKDCAMDTAPRTVIALDRFEVAIVGDSASTAIEVVDQSTVVQRVAVTNYAAGEWNHLGIEYSPDNFQVVVLLNGFTITAVRKASFDWNGWITLGTNVSESSYFEGQMDNFRISDTLRLGFLATIPHPPYSYDSITVAIWSFDSTKFQKAYTSRGDSMFVGAGAHPVVLYDDIIVDTCEGTSLNFAFPTSGSGLSSPANQGFSWNAPVLNWNPNPGIATYELNFSDSNSCLNNTKIFAEIHPAPDLDLGADSVLCEGDSLLLTGASYGNHSWSNSSIGDSLWISSAGKYWVEVIDSNSCTISDTAEFSSIAAPMVELGNDTTLPRYGTIELDAGSGFAHYEWSTLETSQKILATLPNWYWVEVTDSNGCRGRDSIYVLIEGLFPFGLEEEFKKEDVKVWPNPAKDLLHVESKSEHSLVYWAIVGLDGQLINYEDSEASEIDIAKLSTGKYLLWLRREDGKLLSYTFVKSYR